MTPTTADKIFCSCCISEFGGSYHIDCDQKIDGNEFGRLDIPRGDRRSSSQRWRRMGSSWSPMFGLFPGSKTLSAIQQGSAGGFVRQGRNSLRTFSGTWVDAENRSRIRTTRPGGTNLFAATPITWRRKNFAVESSVLLNLADELARPPSCARKRSGGVVIARSFPII